MLRRLGLLFAALALFSMAGGHWAVLQSVAWAGMLHDSMRRTGSVVTAIERTFDGQHPCELCREIRVAKSQEPQGSPAFPNLKDAAKAKALLPDSLLRPVVRTAEAVCFPSAASGSAVSRTEPPLTPPPRRGTCAA